VAEIKGVPVGGGKFVFPLGTDGTDWYGVLVDTAGRLQVDLVNLDDIGDIATQTTLASALTALQSLQNLVGALHDVGLDELDVQVAVSALPTGAATETTLADLNTRIGDETSPAVGTVNYQLDEIDDVLDTIQDLRNVLDSVGTDEARTREILSRQQWFETWKDYSADLPLAVSTTATYASVYAGELWLHEVLVYANDDLNDPLVRVLFTDGDDTLMYTSLRNTAITAWGVAAKDTQRAFGHYFLNIDTVNFLVYYSLLFDPPFHCPNGLKIALRNDSAVNDIDVALQAWVRYTREY